MTILSRYIARYHLKLLALCYGAFTSIYLVIDLLEKVGKLSRAGGSTNDIISLFLWKIPEITTQVLPLALLMATLLTLSGLSRTSELTAMRCSGASLVWISRPILFIALAASLLNLVFTEIVVPKSYEQMRYIQDVRIAKKSPSTFFRKGTIWHRDTSAILRAKMFEPETSTLRGVTVWGVDSNLQPVDKLDAPLAKNIDETWVLEEALQQRFSSGRLAGSERHATLPMKLQMTVADLKIVGKRAEDMGFQDLQRYCRTIEQGGYDATRYRTLMHAKLSGPFSPLVMAFVAVPFSLRSARSSGPALGIGISLIIGLAYFITNAFLISFGQAGALPPAIAAWAANILFIGLGIWLSLTINR